ncbi:MAG TPA: hypothetical protein VGG35_24695 [Streptosporangiaceae bacterium]
MTTHFDYDIRRKRQRLAELAGQTAELERRLADAQLTLDRQLSRPGAGYPSPGEPTGSAESLGHVRQASSGYGAADSYPAYDAAGADDRFEGASGTDASGTDGDHGPGRASGLGPGGYGPGGYGASGLGDAAPGEAGRYEDAGGFGRAYDPPFDPAAGDRTEVLLRHGRAGAAPRLTRRRKLVLAGVAGTTLLIILILVLTAGGASWPGSVAVVERQAAVACRNPDVRSEPSQVNFACAKASRQILWVFALLTSRDDPSFKDARTGRVGLEPISAAQGGQLAWSLNLHHPYHPTNAVDSLAVAARAINNIVGGATLTSAGGRPVVQAGLESSAANCLRYTGSAAMTRRSGFPPHCAHPVTSTAGQAALVADIYQKWVVGAGPRAAQDAAVLFASAQNPGNPEVQAILRRLSADGPLT